MTSVMSALLVVAGAFFMLHLLPVIGFIVLLFFAARMFAGGGRRGWSGRSYRAEWRDNHWNDRGFGRGYYRR